MPAVTIIMPTFNDEAYVVRALESCLSQTYEDIEVICVDDASTDGTLTLLQEVALQDPRVRVLSQDLNQSAFQARKRGVEAATAPHVLFIDGDDELAPQAVSVLVDLASETLADVVGFGVDVCGPDGGRTAPRFERSLQPIGETLVGADILGRILMPGKPAQGHLWKYLWTTELLAGAYADVSSDVQLYRANDLPITFLALEAAQKYVSTSERLYKYYFRRGTSGGQIRSVEDFSFYLGALDSIDAISEAVTRRATLNGQRALDSYESAKRSVIANLLRYVCESALAEVRMTCVAALRARVGDDPEIVRAAGQFYPRAFELLSEHLANDPVPTRPIKNVLITTGNMRAGGVQGVVAAQASLLDQAGFTVTVAVFASSKSAHPLPSSVRFVRVNTGGGAERQSAWETLLRDSDIDIVIDHHVLYNEDWPVLVTTARALGIGTVGWLHNFALRPIVDGTNRISFLKRNLPLLSKVVVLSYTDVAFWKLQGIENVVYLPNPPSPLEAQPGELRKNLSEGPIELAWWGRLQQSTKQVRDLVEIATHLRALDVDFRMRIIGPDSADLTAAQLNSAARKAGVQDVVEATGPLFGEALSGLINSSHLLISTSVIEGYPLTLVEAQSHGLPVVMYELPWLAYAEDNDALLTTRQGDKYGVARIVQELSRDPVRYAELSDMALNAARKANSIDFVSIYQQLLRSELPAESSPSPTSEDAALLLQWAVFYSERAARIARRGADRFAQVEAQLRSVQGDLARVKRHLASLRAGASYRVARTITFLPRWLRGRAGG